MFSRCFAIPKQCKTNKFLNLGLELGVFQGLSWLRSSVAVGAYWGAGRGFPGASALIVHQHTKNSPLPALWCNRFPSFIQ